MISDEQFGDMGVNDIALKYFKEYSSDAKSLNEDEFYKAISSYMVNHVGSDEWSEKLRSENYFAVHLQKGENGLDFESFSDALQEISILVKGGDYEDDFDIDLTL